MDRVRRFWCKPKKTDNSILARFYYADEDLQNVANELDSFDGRKDPERCTLLVNQLRQCQDKVLSICNQIMEETISEQRANRDFRVKFPDDVLQENLAGQLWFGAECLAAGSSIMNREVESASMRPLAKALTESLNLVRTLLREQCLRKTKCYSDKLKDSLRVLDRLFAEFELCYVSAMVPVKTTYEYDMQQDVIVLFSETLFRALKINLISQEMVDDYDPALMFTIPRLAIVCGLRIYPEGPLNVDGDPNDLTEMFRQFQSLLFKIRELLWDLKQSDLYLLEKTLCSVENPKGFKNSSNNNNLDKESLSSLDKTESENIHMSLLPNNGEKVCLDYSICKQFIQEYSEYDFPPPTCDSPFGNEAANNEDEVADNITNEEDEAAEIAANCESGDELAAIQESLSDALIKVIDRSETRDSGIHSDTCSTSSAEPMSGIESISNVNALSEEATSVVSTVVEQVIDTTWCDGQKISKAAKATTGMKEPDKGCSSPGRSPHPKRFRGYSESCSSSPRCQSWAGDELNRPATSFQVVHECLSGQSVASSDGWDTESCSSDASSYKSDYQDKEEIALAKHAVKVATRNKLKSRFCSKEDLIHRLFVCISGVADQLQTNYASDLRNILKCVFQMNCSDPVISSSSDSADDSTDNTLATDGSSSSAETISVDSAVEVNEQYCYGMPTDEPPLWIPDESASHCMSCQSAFTVVRRRHHCRNCGSVFCSRCSSNSVPLPQYGHAKPVRVCNQCFIYQVNPFFIHGDA